MVSWNERKTTVFSPNIWVKDVKLVWDINKTVHRTIDTKQAAQAQTHTTNLKGQNYPKKKKKSLSLRDIYINSERFLKHSIRSVTHGVEMFCLYCTNCTAAPVAPGRGEHLNVRNVSRCLHWYSSPEQAESHQARRSHGATAHTITTPHERGSRAVSR